MFYRFFTILFQQMRVICYKLSVSYIALLRDSTFLHNPQGDNCQHVLFTCWRDIEKFYKMHGTQPQGYVLRC